jgi:capsule polysaccharide export protein KpsE/RkpR
MTPPRNIIGALYRAPILRRPWWRRALFAVLILISALLTLFPERYRAAVTLTPTDPSSLGLGSTLGQLGALNTAFGNQAAVEVSLKVARSVYVRDTVIRQMNLVRRLDVDNALEASRWLERRVDIRTMRGGILQIETLNRDAAFGQKLVSTFQDAIRNRLAEIARRQTAYKRRVLEQLVREASDRVRVAETAYNRFRLGSRFADPRFSFSAISQRIPNLQAAIRAKEVQLNAERQFGTDDNPSVRQVQAELASLRRQLVEARAVNPQDQESTGQVVRQSTEVRELERQLLLAQSLYDGYRRYLEGTAVEDLTSTATVRVLEPPFVDTARQYNLVPAGMAVLLILLALAIEFYGFRPPVGERRHPYD